MGWEILVHCVVLTYKTMNKFRKLHNEVTAAGFWAFVFLLAIASYGARRAIKWEEKNKVEVWVTYEIGYKDLDKVILYKGHDRSDSLVFRVDSVNPFAGRGCVQKLEYRLP